MLNQHCQSISTGLEQWYLFEGTRASAMSMRSSYAKNLAISCQNNDKWNEEECHGYYQTFHTSLYRNRYHQSSE